MGKGVILHVIILKWWHRPFDLDVRSSRFSIWVNCTEGLSLEKDRSNLSWSMLSHEKVYRSKMQDKNETLTGKFDVQTSPLGISFFLHLFGQGTGNFAHWLKWVSSSSNNSWKKNTSFWARPISFSWEDILIQVFLLFFCKTKTEGGFRPLVFEAGAPRIKFPFGLGSGPREPKSWIRPLFGKNQLIRKAEKKHCDFLALRKLHMKGTFAMQKSHVIPLRGQSCCVCCSRKRFSNSTPHSFGQLVVP